MPDEIGAAIIGAFNPLMACIVAQARSIES
jgi:hypothetical protein